MKKFVFILILALSGISAWAGTEYRDACRQIIYAVRPVDEIGKVADARLKALARFALGIAVEGEEALTETDALLFSFLANVELKRRASSSNEFSLHLQERKEYLRPLMRGSGDVTPYIKMDNWVDMYQLNLITG